MVRTKSPTITTERVFLRASRPKARCRDSKPEGCCVAAFRRSKDGRSRLSQRPSRFLSHLWTCSIRLKPAAKSKHCGSGGNLSGGRLIWRAARCFARLCCGSMKPIIFCFSSCIILCLMRAPRKFFSENWLTLTNGQAREKRCSFPSRR